MAYIDYTSEYKFGLQEIDMQHKKLFDLINGFYDGLTAGKGKAILGELVQGLVDYAIYHFKTEENYMLQYNYSDYTTHKGEHDNFNAKVTDVNKRFREGKLVLSSEITNFVKDWIINHILVVDKKYVPFFRSQGMQ